MEVHHPSDCKNEASRWSFDTKLYIGVLIPERYRQGQSFRDKKDELFALIGYDLSISFDFVERYWKLVLNGGTVDDLTFPGIPKGDHEQATVIKDTSSGLLKDFRAYYNGLYIKQRGAVLHSRNTNIAIAQQGSHWKPDPAVHWINDRVVYPDELNEENEGSRGAFLHGLRSPLINNGLIPQDIIDLENKLIQAQQDAVDGNRWAPTLGDIR